MFDAADIPLPEEPQAAPHPHLLHLQGQVDKLTQTMAGLVMHLQQHPVLIPASVQPPPIPLAPSRSHHHNVVSECYDGNPEGCRRFVLACELYFLEYPEMPPQEKVTFMIQCLTAWAYDWAEAVWGLPPLLQPSPATTSQGMSLWRWDLRASHLESENEGSADL